MIKLIIFDIDGCVTDGSIIVDEHGAEQKRINIKDIDAIFELKSSGFMIGAITGERTRIVDYFEKRFPWDYFFSGSKAKVEVIRQIQEAEHIESEEICYVGDGKYDVEPLKYCGLAVCPKDSIDRARAAADIILQHNGGEGCLWELIAILEAYNHGISPQGYFLGRTMEHIQMFSLMASDSQLIADTMEVAERIAALLNDQGQVFLCGNGGSAADAQHIATEFVSRFYHERRALNAEALTVNTSILTAISNDYSYERVFVRQLEAKARKGDIVIGMSTSGKSKNVIEALHYAHQHGLLSVLLTGDCDVSEARGSIDYVIKVPSRITPRIQEAHIFIGHLIAEYVEQKMHNLSGSDDQA